MEILNYIFEESDLIDKGGMGSVYKARHKFIEGERAAIKVINANMMNDFTRQLLQQEAENLSSLNHPNIVQFKNYHIDEKGNVYLIMEYVEGLSLDKYLRKETGLIVESRICPLFEPILDAVEYAHKRGAHGKGIMHLDIKPSNIIIKKETSRDGEVNLVPKILDFGIAQIIKSCENQDNEAKTSTGKPRVIMGTPSYMSPEQTKGEALDSRSDIYSLGVLLHQMLIGRPPYDTTTLSEFDINRKVIEEPLPRIKSFYEQHSSKVQKVIDKATAKDKKDRYQSCEDFKKALHNAIYPPKVPGWVKVGVAAAVAILIGLGGWFWDYNRVKVSYYKDYAEQWGVPVGIGELSSSEHSHAHRSYKFEKRRGKLLRVSHVNSLDNVIDDNESERNERPIDQEFFYSAEGKVSRVYVKDRSGKVLYVKSYNDKLNVMAFQYNDEHNTERILSNSMVGYGRLLENYGDDRGHISRWWIEYDENGFVKKESFHGLDNSAVGDNNGIFGRSYVRDEKGRPIEIHYLGIDGQPQPTSWGLGIKKFVYDEKDNWISAIYQTVDEQPAFDDVDGISIFDMEYDDYGNVVAFYHKDGEGEPMCPKKNYVSGGCYVYDDKGLNVRDEYWDMDLKPMFIQNTGVAIVKTEYDGNGYVAKKTFCDPDGNITNCKDGNAIMECVNDAHGNPLEVWYKNTMGELCEVADGYAGIRFEYDSIGNQTMVVYFGKDREPVVQNDGYAGTQYSFDEMNRIVELTNLGKDLQPVENNNNVVKVRYEYDKRGNMTKLSFYEPDGQTLRLSGEGIAGWEDVYDESGNHIERRYFDTIGNPVVSPATGYAVVKYTYDENEHLKSVRYLDVNGDLVLVDKKAGRDYVNDKRGNVLEDKPLGKNGRCADGYLIKKMKYDQYNNCIEMALFDESGPANNSLKVHRYEYDFNTRNQRIEERHYGKDGKLVLIDNEKKCAIERSEYDDKGDCVKTSYYGTDEKPCLCKEGWWCTTREFDVFGHVVKQCFFGLDGKPTDPKVIVPVGICEYDKWGNMIYLAAQDGNGNFINKDGQQWAMVRMEYDKRNNCTKTSYFDAQNKPALDEKAYHKWIASYDDFGHLVEKSYFGIDGKPVLYNGYHKVTYKYDVNNRQCVEEVYFGIKGEPASSKSAGYHKRVKAYNNDKQETLDACYNTKGKVVSKTETTYDELGRIKTQKETDAKGNVYKGVFSYKGNEKEPNLTKIYDGEGHLLATLDAKGNMVPVKKPSTYEESDVEIEGLQDIVDGIQSTLPQEIEGTDLVISSCRKVGKSTIEFTFVVKKSKSEMDRDEITVYSTACSVIMEALHNQVKDETGMSITMKSVLKDNKGIVL